nr:hypothetical protein [uncultured Pseudomonas sp.]
MNDQQFERDTEALRHRGYVSFVEAVRARDTAQREALARVEAERDTAIAQMQNIRKQRDAINKELGDTAFNLCIAQQQLAEAMKLIDQHYNDLGDACGAFQSQHDVNIVERFLDVLQAFLARHAQAEQQEAQGVQAADERAEVMARLHEIAYRDTAVSVTVRAADLRAALATQPAAIKLPDRKRTDHLSADYKTMTPTRASIESYNRALDDVAALNAVRGAEHE